MNSFGTLCTSGNWATFLGVEDASEIVQALGIPPKEAMRTLRLNEDQKRNSVLLDTAVGVPCRPIPVPVPFGQQAVAPSLPPTSSLTVDGRHLVLRFPLKTKN